MTTTPLILIVEDHEYMRTLLARLVAETYPGATIVLATNGTKALAAYNQQRPDLIISDQQLPIMSGVGLVRTLRDQGATVPILMLSSDSTGAEAILSGGANQFLPKPFVFSEFTRALRTLLPIAPQ
jgi:DNA-binding response OmpR family regulator